MKGWRHEPVRHALSAKGVSTTTEAKIDFIKNYDDIFELYPNIDKLKNWIEDEMGWEFSIDSSAYEKYNSIEMVVGHRNENRPSRVLPKVNLIFDDKSPYLINLYIPGTTYEQIKSYNARRKERMYESAERLDWSEEYLNKQLRKNEQSRSQLNWSLDFINRFSEAFGDKKGVGIYKGGKFYEYNDKIINDIKQDLMNAYYEGGNR